MNYATIEDLELVFRPLTESEKDKAEELIAETSAKIRLRAKKYNKDFDALVESDEDLAVVTKGVVCNVVRNALNVPIDQEAMTQLTMSAGGYSWSGTYATPGGGIKLSKADWKSLGLGTQMFGGFDIYGIGN